MKIYTNQWRRPGFWKQLPIIALCTMTLLAGCGDDVTEITTTETALDQARSVDPEQCVICHADQGQKHQDVYNKYKDASTLELTLDGVTSAPNATDPSTFDATLDFTIRSNGELVDLGDGLPSLNQKRFYSTVYDSGTGTFSQANNFSWSANDVVSNGGGTYSVTATGVSFAPEDSNAQVYAYIGEGPLDTEAMTLYDNVSNAALAYGDPASNANTYQSVANVEACEGCHGVPYMKHGYRAAKVANVGDFVICKNCHLDDRNGSHQDWQLLVDNPVQYATYFDMIDPSSRSTDSVTDFMTDAEKAKYAYKRNLMNDVHMAHAMEFPYPQSMKNCKTCHDGKLDQVLTDDNFRITTCKSCHAVTGGVNESGTVDTTEFALNVMAKAANESHLDLATATDAVDCSLCHSLAPSLEIAPPFDQLHTGYDSEIYTADGTRYSDAFAVSIDSASFVDNKVTFTFTATESVDIADMAVTDMTPKILIALYAYDTKHTAVYTHERFDSNGDGQITRADEANLEYDVGSEHPYFTTDDAANGSWTVTVDLTNWADLISSGEVKRIGIGVRPTLKDPDGTTVALVAPTRTFDLATRGFDDNFYPPIVKVEGGCNNCHDALATSFHTPDRGGNIEICRMCHSPLAAGASLELQSRSIDSYVHAVHSFAPFDPGDVDLSDPVERVEFKHHISNTFPNFTTKNCEACHNPGVFNPPDQGKSLPGILSGTDTVTERNIGSVSSVVTGPGARACGACHRAHAINDDDENKLIAINAHTKTHGYAITAEEGVIDAVIDRIMSIFN